MELINGEGKIDYGASEVNLSAERSSALIRMQGELMQRALKSVPDIEKAEAGLKWIDAHSDAYRELLDKNPDLLTRFMSTETKEEAIEEVERRLVS